MKFIIRAVIEVAIGIIKADKKLEKPEINFIKQLITNLKIPSIIINSRFGNWDVLENEINDTELSDNN